LASLRALLRAHLREDIDAARRPEFPWVWPQARTLRIAGVSVRPWLGSANSRSGSCKHVSSHGGVYTGTAVQAWRSSPRPPARGSFPPRRKSQRGAAERVVAEAVAPASRGLRWKHRAAASSLSGWRLAAQADTSPAWPGLFVGAGQRGQYLAERGVHFDVGERVATSGAPVDDRHRDPRLLSPVHEPQP
jgi:hypothetical protein